MKSSFAVSCIFSALLSATTFAQAVSTKTDVPGAANAPATQNETPAQQKISAAQLEIKADPKKVQAYNELALAYLRRTRETANPSYLKDADAAIAQGVNLDPKDFQLQRTQVAVMLGHHEFIKAREQAAALHRSTPDDVMTYGYIAEADIALGNYPEAETNTQWMFNLRTNNTPALLIGAELRILYGDTPGALEFLNLTYSETSPTEPEELAWIANQIASIQIESGQSDAASQILEKAGQLFPNYPYTIENLARARIGQNRVNDAIQLWMQAAKIDKDPHILYELAKAQDVAGESKEARATYAEFEKLASNPETATSASRLDLILMYAGNAASAPKALTLAQQEIVARQDVWTLDAYAWALYANAKYRDASAAEQKAIAVGIRSAQIFDHAGHIAQKLNQTADSTKYFVLALQANPFSEYASDARQFVGTPGIAEKAPIASLVAATAATSQTDLPPSPATNANLPAPNPPFTMATPAFAPVPESLLVPRSTGTEQAIRNAQLSVARSSNDAKAFAGLGAAYFQRARESGDVADYQLAEQSIGKSLDLVSQDFSADAPLETMAEICMGEHRFADALTYAHKALSLGTGDISPFAIVGDAYADMGEYDKAHDAYGHLTPPDMTLSPRAAYARDSRLSYLKFIAGDTTGAISLMKTAVAEGVEAQLPSENLAWLYYELGEYFTQAGDGASADSAYLTALEAHPGDYRALAALAKLRANNGRSAEAIGLYQKAIAVVPMPIFIAELGDLYAKSGNQAEARKQYALIEYIGLLGHINQVLHNRDLALFYADHDMKLPEALDLAQKELEVRHDVYTWDAIAWALYKNNRLTDAAKASQKALQYGTRDSLLLFHAGMIAEAMGQPEQAQTELEEALQINPHFHLIYAKLAQQRLTALEAQSQSKGGRVSHGF
jgi:tetratricopeptide (TPR) repeat protein